MQSKETKTKTKSKKRQPNLIVMFMLIVLLVVAVSAAFYFSRGKLWDLDGSRNYPRREDKPVGRVAQAKQQYSATPERIPAESVVETEVEVSNPEVANDNLLLPAIGGSSNQELPLQLQKLSLAIDALPDVIHGNITTTDNTVQSTTGPAKEATEHKTAVDNLKSVVRVSKRVNKDKTKSTHGSLQLYKIQLKLLANDMRWAMIYNDVAAFNDAKKLSLAILQKRFDMADSSVDNVAGMLNELNIENDYVGEY